MEEIEKITLRRLINMTNRKSLSTTQKGFSLIELMVTVGVSSVIMLGMGSMTAQMSSNYNNFSQKMGVMSLVNEFMVTANTFGNCNGLFGAGFPTGFNEAMATSATGWPIYVTLSGENLTAGFTSPRTSTYFQTVQFQMPNPAARIARYTTPITATYFGLINYTAQRTTQKTGGMALRPRIMGPIAIRVNSANALEACVGLQSPEFRCIMSATTPNTWNIGTGTCVP